MMSQYINTFTVAQDYVNMAVTLQFVIVYINVMKPILIVRLASAGTNEMLHHEFNKSRLHPPKVN
jgi:uncharacterized membrane protein